MRSSNQSEKKQPDQLHAHSKIDRALSSSLGAGTGNDLKRILAFPHLTLGQWPTPIETVLWDGRPFLVKRDDLSGFGRGGAKTRKIEHVLGLMRVGGYNELITVIGNITNLGFDLLPALRAQGFSWRIFVQDDPPLPREIRTACFHGIESDVQMLGGSRTLSTVRVIGEYLRRRATGRRPLLLLPGASHPAGVVGNARGFIEMVEQLRAAGEPLPGKVFVSLATGTTLAGFLLAENALRRSGGDSIQIIGVQVYQGDAAWRTLRLLRWTERKLGLEHAVAADRIDVRSEALAGGFGRSSLELDGLCRRILAETGMAIDPIFGGKTWSVMASVAQAEPSCGRPSMYWNCGHTPGWEGLMNSVRSSREPVNGPVANDSAVIWKWTAGKLAIVMAYLVCFYGILPLFLGKLGRRFDEEFQLPPMHFQVVKVAGWLCLAAGLSMVVSSIASLFKTGRGLPISHLPPSRLVHGGHYGWTRHPHYVGYNLLIVGGGLLQESWGLAVGAGTLLLGLWLLYVLVFEEPRLLRRFGQGYECYRVSVGILPLPSASRGFQHAIRHLKRPLEALANRIVLFRTGPILWVTFGFFAALGTATMTMGVAWFLFDRGCSGRQIWEMVSLMCAAIPFASRIAWLVLPGDKPKGRFSETMRRVGFVSWGGYVAIFATGAWVGRLTGIPPLRMLDIVVMMGLFASAVSRWGCLSYGCCIGRCADWGLLWTNPAARIHRLRPGGTGLRIPTQLLSSFHAGFGGLVLLAFSFHRSAPGALAALGGMLYSLSRFGVEHFREEARFGRWQLTAGQIGCIAAFALSILLLFGIQGPPSAFWQGQGPGVSWPWLLACVATSSGIIFFTYGPHWKRIGQW